LSVVCCRNGGMNLGNRVAQNRAERALAAAGTDDRVVAG
jgi:hypothetical protein